MIANRSKLNKLKESERKYFLGITSSIKAEKEILNPNKSLPNSQIIVERCEHIVMRPEHKNQLKFNAIAQSINLKIN